MLEPAQADALDGELAALLALASQGRKVDNLILDAVAKYPPAQVRMRELLGAPAGYRGYRPAPGAGRPVSAQKYCCPQERLFAIEEPLPTKHQGLPYCRPEVEGALSWFAETDRFHLSGERATGEAVLNQAAQYSVLHFACHGQTERNPLQSGLVMAHNEAVMIRDFLDARLSHCRLAILSACESGLFSPWTAEEVVGLPLALMLAGVGGVVGSLWSVLDLSTMMLMKRFYELWKGEAQLHPAEALRQAQIWVRNIPERKCPFHWAAFSYTGV